jgi:hypothetical protein
MEPTQHYKDFYSFTRKARAHMQNIAADRKWGREQSNAFISLARSIATKEGCDTGLVRHVYAALRQTTSL